MKTHEEKLRALLPKKLDCPATQEIEIYCDLCSMIEGCYVHGYNKLLDDYFNAIKDKVILREELLSKEDLKTLIINSSLCHVCLSNVDEATKELDELSQIIVEAQKKAGLV